MEFDRRVKIASSDKADYPIVEFTDGFLQLDKRLDGTILKVYTHEEGEPFTSFYSFGGGKAVDNIMAALLIQGIHSIRMLKDILYRSEDIGAYSVDSLITREQPSLGEITFPNTFHTTDLPAQNEFSLLTENLQTLSKESIATFSGMNARSTDYFTYRKMRVPVRSIVGLHSDDYTFNVVDSDDRSTLNHELATAFSSGRYVPSMDDYSYSRDPISCSKLGPLYWVSSGGRHRAGVLRGMQEFSEHPLILDIMVDSDLTPEKGRPTTVVARTEADIDIIEKRFKDGTYIGKLEVPYYKCNPPSSIYCIMGWVSEIEHPWSLARDLDYAKELYCKSVQEICKVLRGT
jgi:hypothetical protein